MRDARSIGVSRTSGTRSRLLPITVRTLGRASTRFLTLERETWVSARRPIPRKAEPEANTLPLESAPMHSPGRTLRFALVLPLLVALAAACGGGGATPPRASGPAGGAPAPGNAAPKPHQLDEAAEGHLEGPS